MKKLLIVAVLAILALTACAWFSSDPLEATIKVTPTTTEEEIIVFDGEYQSLDTPDELGLTSLSDERGMRLKWPISGNTRSLSLSFEFETVNVSDAQALLIGLVSDDNRIRFGELVFRSEEGEEWTYRHDSLGGDSIGLPTDGFELDLIEIPRRVRATLNGVELNFHNNFGDSELVLEGIRISR